MITVKENGGSIFPFVVIMFIFNLVNIYNSLENINTINVKPLARPSIPNRYIKNNNYMEPCTTSISIGPRGWELLLYHTASHKAPQRREKMEKTLYCFL